MLGQVCNQRSSRRGNHVQAYPRHPQSAAVELPDNSVGNRQIRNNAIQPDKLDSAYTRGEIRAWARVSAKGKVIGGGHGIKVEPQGSVKGDYFVEPARNGDDATTMGKGVEGGPAVVRARAGLTDAAERKVADGSVGEAIVDAGTARGDIIDNLIRWGVEEAVILANNFSATQQLIFSS